jgi:hypothetical protein
VGHRRAGLTPLGRRLPRGTVLIEGWNQAALGSATRVFSREHGQVDERFREESPGRPRGPLFTPAPSTTHSAHELATARARVLIASTRCSVILPPQSAECSEARALEDLRHRPLHDPLRTVAARRTPAPRGEEDRADPPRGRHRVFGRSTERRKQRGRGAFTSSTSLWTTTRGGLPGSPG